METLVASRDEALRRALLVAIPVGTQLSNIGLDSISRAADSTLRLATWSVTSAVRKAGASAAFVNRNMLAPLSNFAFGGSNNSSTSNVHFCTQTCPQLLPDQGRKHHPSRSEIRYQRVASNLRSGSAKCSLQRNNSQRHSNHQQPSIAAAAAPALALLATHLAASCALRPTSPTSSSSPSKEHLSAPFTMQQQQQQQQRIMLGNAAVTVTVLGHGSSSPGGKYGSGSCFSDEAEAVEWTVNTLGLQSSML
ncbi:hypothetical protein Agub_g12597 [Astrephomene gubernaculifera]|uniref:Uncharacterized protein n=1 Tax=Astrephomene gubernaculifera TaxID=47775 RepID=A0AAD3DYW8_9CHLO|nr:hypothetical protein Agub_g12597 [Astrephomene gubernaculifera]